MPETDITSSHAAHLVSLTRQLILHPSTEFENEERHRCLETIHSHLEVLPEIDFHEFEHNGIESLVVLPAGCKKPEILICGHIDVVAHANTSDYASRIEGNRIVGPGAGDMKGAVAIVVELFMEIQSNHPGASLGLAITSDEERGGRDGIGYLFQDGGLECGLALVPDGGSLNCVTIEEKGILHLRAKCEGSAGHGARPWLGDNALQKMMNALCGLEAHFASAYPNNGSHWHPTCTVSTISTPNRTINRIPAHATAGLDVRFPAPFSSDTMLEEMRGALGNTIDLEVIIAAEPTALKPEPDYVTITEEVTGKPVELDHSDGGSDARFIAARGIPVIISRPLVGNLHALDEWIDIPSMTQFYEIYRRFICKRLGLELALEK